MHNNRSLLLATAAAALGLASGASHAIPITSTTNNPLAFSWSYLTDAATTLTGTGSLTVSGFNSSALDVAVMLTNTSALGGLGGERLTSFGFGIGPNATSVSFIDASDGGMRGAQFAFGALPANVVGIEVCAFGGPNCSGGGPGGIFGAGGTDSFIVRLLGTWGSSVDIAPIGLRYQTGYGSYTFESPPRIEVPEPSAIALIGLVLIG
jgi:hypothetical protein